MANWKILLINLDKRPDRLEFVKEQLDKFGLGFERVAGVDGSKLTEDEIAKAYSPQKNRREYVRPLQRGQIGCYLAHARAWRAAAEENLDFAVVLEDDVYLRDYLPAALHALENAYPNWDFVRLEENYKPKKIFAETPLKSPYSFVQYINTPGGARAYALSGAAAKKMASLIPFGMPVDVQQQYLYKLGIRLDSLRPAPFYNGEKGLDSDLNANARRHKRHYPMCRQVLSVSFYVGRLCRLRKEYGTITFLKNLAKMLCKKPVI